MYVLHKMDAVNDLNTPCIYTHTMAQRLTSSDTYQFGVLDNQINYVNVKKSYLSNDNSNSNDFR